MSGWSRAAPARDAAATLAAVPGGGENTTHSSSKRSPVGWTQLPVGAGRWAGSVGPQVPVAGLQGGPGLGKLGQAAGHGHQRPGPTQRHAALPGHPLLGRADAGPGPRLGGQDLADERHQPTGGHIEDAALFGNLLLKDRRLGFRAHGAIVVEQTFDHKAY